MLFPHDRPERPDELRRHYATLFKHPLCQGIYSHIPETLQDFSRFFSDPAIDEKLLPSKIGLSRLDVNPEALPPRQPIDRPRFLFIASARAPDDFFDRGGACRSAILEGTQAPDERNANREWPTAG